MECHKGFHRSHVSTVSGVVIPPQKTGPTGLREMVDVLYNSDTSSKRCLDIHISNEVAEMIDLSYDFGGWWKLFRFTLLKWLVVGRLQPFWERQFWGTGSFTEDDEAHFFRNIISVDCLASQLGCTLSLDIVA